MYLQALEIHSLVFLAASIFIYRRNKEFKRLEVTDRMKDQIIQYQMKLLKKQTKNFKRNIFIKDGDMVMNNLN